MFLIAQEKGTNEHLELIQRASRKRSIRAIGVEKPVSLSVDEIHTAFKCAPKLMVAFQRFVDPEFLRLPKQTGLQAILSANGDHPCPPRELLSSLGSIFHDLLIHDISQVLLGFSFSAARVSYF